MFSQVTSLIAERVQQLEGRVKELEARGEALDAQLKELKKNSNDTTQTPVKLRFCPFSSKTGAEFFRQLGENKLNEYKLSDEPVNIIGTYTVDNGRDQQKAWLEVRAESFAAPHSDNVFAHEHIAYGTLLNVNTLEQFKSLDKKALLATVGSKLLADIESGSVFAHPIETLSRFVLLTYADLKKHRYLYWFGFPVFHFSVGCEPYGTFRPLKTALPGVFEAFSDVTCAELSFFFVHNGKPLSFTEWPNLREAALKNDVTIGFFDSSPLKENPGWHLRNLLLFASHPQGLALAGRNLNVICIRDFVTSVPREPTNSTVWEINIPEFDTSNVMGWEPNIQDKMGPRMADLSDILDATKLAESACSLNLRLMKWRAFPELNDQKLADTKVLLFGAGTLGCAVARGLLGWGFRNFTFVDSGRVSFSNPVRQSLFVSADCVGRGKWKAQTAAERCKEIHPTVNSDYWVGNILMPGHAGDPNSQEDFAKIDSLIRSHDVICLLTDTRESRWLPTVIGAAHDKIVLNAALGFDSYVVLRHGSIAALHPRLGCYFCTDVVAPTDSTRDRTLDQQCTVTRPGAAPIAAAILVEMLVGLLHHPLQHRAKSQMEINRLGVLPHQIRGYLGSFQNTLVTGQAFPQCTACSEAVLQAYNSQGFDFVKRVMEDPNYLEQLTGLDKLKNSATAEGQDFDDFAYDEDDFGED